MPIHEQNLNQTIAEILSEMRRRWRVDAEETGILRDKGKRPDIVVWRDDRPAVLIENEFMPARTVESDAMERLGLEIIKSDKVRAVIALRSSAELKNAAASQLKKRAAAAEFDYALFTRTGAGDTVRFPESGWLTGGLSDLSDFVYRSSVSSELLDKMAILLARGIQKAAAEIKDSDSEAGAEIQKILQQQDGIQTRRMAMLILLNALIFQEMFGGHYGIRMISGTCEGGVRKQNFLDEWEKVLGINYWPIFHVARRILLVLPEPTAKAVIVSLHGTASDVMLAFSSHDLFGRVFQRLIADRKFLATFYTRPASAALLANLAVPENAPFAGGSWKDNAAEYVIADFACGTGALLSAAYQRAAELHEKHGGDLRKSHARFMENALIGCDIMPAAVHLTASILAAINPKELFEDTRLYAFPYGEPKKGEYRIGALELLADKSFLPVISTSAKKKSGQGESESEFKEIPWRSANLVIMNPPFTRPTKFVKGYINPAFAAFGAPAELQSALGERNKTLRAETCGSGNAGLASDFVALADKMVCQNGMVAFVLPLTVMAGESWDYVRELWTRDYDDMCVISLSAYNDDDCSFSADTGMAEILFVGKRMNGRNGAAHKNPRAIFVSLNRRPEDEIQGYEFARIIKSQRRGGVAKLEDGPYGGTPIFAGKARIGGMLDAPLSCLGTPWSIARVRDMTLAQISHALVGGLLWIPGTPKKRARKIPVCALGDFAERGFIARDINGAPPRGPFDIHADEEISANENYPCLWSHDAKRETRLVVAPDSYGVVRKHKEAKDKALKIWQFAGRAHFNIHCRFNSQPLTVAITEKPAIGGTAWPNVILKNRGQECAFALWGNSTLGFLLYWWWSNKQQSGRGSISPVRIPTMPVLDLTKLSGGQLAAARRGFNAVKNEPLLPFYRANEDKTRAELDKIILADVLGLPKTVLDGVAIVREKLCGEPSVRGGKE